MATDSLNTPPAAPLPTRAGAAPVPAWFAALTLRRILITLALAVVAAAAINPMFVTPFPVVLGRVLVVAAMMLLAFAVAGRWRPGWLPGWLAQVSAVVLAAPLATLAVYLPSAGGSLSAVLQHEGMVWGVLSITGVTLLIAPVLALGALYRERDAQARNQQLQFELEKSTLERQALDTRLRLLHSQIEPHFLFNTLANVQALVERGSPQAAPVLGSLIAYLRAAMPRLEAIDGTLGTEIALVRSYLDLMRLRMPDRLRYRITIEPGLQPQRFPPMALLTLVENAVRHGIDPSEQGGDVVVGASMLEPSEPAQAGAEASRQGGSAGRRLCIWVADDGVGMAETALPGTGMNNLRARLTAFYGAGARLELLEQAPHGLRAQIVLEAGAVSPAVSLAAAAGPVR